MLRLYARGGFYIETILMDMEFENDRDLIPQVNINTSATNEHVAEVERRIQMIKERCRGVLGILPFKHLPKKLIIGLVQFVTMWNNTFPCSARFSRMWSPQELICRHKLDAEKHCKTPFGTYCEVHNEPDP